MKKILRRRKLRLSSLKKSQQNKLRNQSLKKTVSNLTNQRVVRIQLKEETMEIAQVHRLRTKIHLFRKLRIPLVRSILLTVLISSSNLGCLKRLSWPKGMFLIRLQTMVFPNSRLYSTKHHS